MVVVVVWADAAALVIMLATALQPPPPTPKTAMVMCTAHDQLTQDLSPLCTRGLLERVLQTARDEIGIEFSGDNRLNGDEGNDFARTAQEVFEEVFFEKVDSIVRQYNLPIVFVQVFFRQRFMVLKP